MEIVNRYDKERKENIFVWHWLPFCCAKRGNSKHWFDGRNYLWLNWMFVFNKNTKGTDVDKCEQCLKINDCLDHNFIDSSQCK